MSVEVSASVSRWRQGRAPFLYSAGVVLIGAALSWGLVLGFFAAVQHFLRGGR